MPVSLSLSRRKRQAREREGTKAAPWQEAQQSLCHHCLSALLDGFAHLAVVLTTLINRFRHSPAEISLREEKFCSMKEEKEGEDDEDDDDGVHYTISIFMYRFQLSSCYMARMAWYSHQSQQDDARQDARQPRNLAVKARRMHHNEDMVMHIARGCKYVSAERLSEVTNCKPTNEIANQADHLCKGANGKDYLRQRNQLQADQPDESYHTPRERHLVPDFQLNRCVSPGPVQQSYPYPPSAKSPMDSRLQLLNENFLPQNAASGASVDAASKNNIMFHPKHNERSLMPGSKQNEAPCRLALNSASHFQSSKRASLSFESSWTLPCQPSHDLSIEDKEMIYRAAALQPLSDMHRSCSSGSADSEANRPKPRRNVRISKDPQSMAARHRRQRISTKMRMLQKLVPGGVKMDTASMLEEAANYMRFLKAEVEKMLALEQLIDAARGRLYARPVSSTDGRPSPLIADVGTNQTTVNDESRSRKAEGLVLPPQDVSYVDSRTGNWSSKCSLFPWVKQAPSSPVQHPQSSLQQHQSIT